MRMLEVHALDNTGHIMGPSVVNDNESIGERLPPILITCWCLVRLALLVIRLDTGCIENESFA
jgi:hypothetical protein